MAAWTSFHPPVTGLALVSQETRDKVLGCTEKAVKSEFPSTPPSFRGRSSWLVIVALGGTGSSLLSLSCLSFIYLRGNISW